MILSLQCNSCHFVQADCFPCQSAAGRVDAGASFTLLCDAPKCSVVDRIAREVEAQWRPPSSIHACCCRRCFGDLRRRRVWSPRRHRRHPRLPSGLLQSGIDLGDGWQGQASPPATPVVVRHRRPQHGVLAPVWRSHHDERFSARPAWSVGGARRWAPMISRRGRWVDRTALTGPSCGWRLSPRSRAPPLAPAGSAGTAPPHPSCSRHPPHLPQTTRGPVLVPTARHHHPPPPPTRQ
jgi:hypothetical protein